jgi:hypothetical protein
MPDPLAATGVNVVHVPYRGDAQAIPDPLGVHICLATLTSTTPICTVRRIACFGGDRQFSGCRGEL